MAKIYPLSEGVFTVGHDKKFVPFDMDNDELNERPTGSLLVEVQPFLVVTEKDIIVFDTGLGFSNADGELQIHSNIKKCGYDPAKVNKVLLSHLHKDHLSGAVHYDVNGIVQSTFPNADYYIYRPEADFALQEGNTSYIKKDVEALLSTKQIKWLDGEEGLIDGYIKFMHSGGHCPQHIVYLVNDGADKIFYGGDEAPQLKQMKMRYIARYDYDGKKAMELRQQYVTKGHEEGWQFLFYHDVKTPVATL
jgi:glyoxylase-like metal-dependent hydrolase (beta-lactamase superfamily II)